jgi:hypothetical protein
MFEWFVNLWVSFMTFIYSLFGMEYAAKSVHFDEGAKKESVTDVVQPSTEGNPLP